MTLSRCLERLGACDDSVKYATYYTNLRDAWASCERYDWMIWLLDYGDTDEAISRRWEWMFELYRELKTKTGEHLFIQCDPAIDTLLQDIHTMKSQVNNALAPSTASRIEGIHDTRTHRIITDLYYMSSWSCISKYRAMLIVAGEYTTEEVSAILADSLRRFTSEEEMVWMEGIMRHAEDLIDEFR